MKMAGIGAGEVEYVVDDNIYKTGRFLPGTAVPIRAGSGLKDNPPDVIVLFAWNFFEDILRKLSGGFSKPVEVVVPLPQLRVVPL